MKGQNKRATAKTGRKGLGLRGRMTLSYVSMAVFNVLLLELLIGGAFLFAILFSPAADLGLQPAAQQTAQEYATAAKLQGAGVALDARMTFQPGKPFSIALAPTASAQGGKNSSNQNSFVSQQISYIDSQSATTNVTSFALLIGPDARVLASSYPARYRASTPVEQLLPNQAQYIREALDGLEYIRVVDAGRTHTAFVAEPVKNRDQSRTIGAVYVQISWDLSGGDLLWGAVRIWLFSGFIWLIIMGPLGTLFGMLTTRGLIRRIHGLVGATAQFATGDYTQRVAVKKRDEIGQLESQFNTMAEQLVESIKKQQELIEHNARMEERARMEQELQTAWQIQHSLLPKELPVLAGWQIATYYQPAREVGGDLYDFLVFRDGRLGLVIGDVTDKGVPAAMVMASTRSMLRAAAQVSDSPGEVLMRVNNLLYADTPAKMFATCFYAILEPKSGILRYANAGHDLPYQRGDGEVAELLATGMPLGLMPGMHYEEREVSIASGESILFYSDGLVEAHNSRREMFGFPRLKSLLIRHTQETSLIDFVLGELQSFTGETWEQEDDVTLVTLQRMPELPMTEAQPEKHNPGKMLLTWSVASQPGNEQEAMERMAEIVQPLNLPPDRLANLKTAVAEVVMNAMEHGNRYQPDKMVVLQVYASTTDVTVRVSDQGEGEPLPDLDTIAAPDLAAKLAGSQTPRGWGLFLIKSLVDELHMGRENDCHVIELVMSRPVQA